MCFLFAVLIMTFKILCNLIKIRSNPPLSYLVLILLFNLAIEIWSVLDCIPIVSRLYLDFISILFVYVLVGLLASMEKAEKSRESDK